MNAYEKHFKRLEILEDFLMVHPEMVEFVELLELVKKSENVTATIKHGKSLSPDAFSAIMISEKDNPRISFIKVGAEPMVLIQDFRGNTSLFSFGLWHTNVISICAVDFPDAVNYTVKLTYLDSEYELCFHIKNTDGR